MNEIDNRILTPATCCLCGTEFALEKRLAQLRRNDGLDFYCPNGHAQYYTNGLAAQLGEARAESDRWRAEAQRLLEEVDRLREAKIDRDREASSLLDQSQKNRRWPW